MPHQRKQTFVLFYFEGEAYRLPMDFIQRHPNHDSLLLPYAGLDITDAFHDAGHSVMASRALSRFRVTSEEVEKACRVGGDAWSTTATAADAEDGALSDSSREADGSDGSLHAAAACDGAGLDVAFDYTGVTMRRRCPMRKVLAYLKRQSGDRLALSLTTLTVSGVVLTAVSLLAVRARATRQ